MDEISSVAGEREHLVTHGDDEDSSSMEDSGSSTGGSLGDEDTKGSHIRYRAEPLDEGVIGMAITSIVCDSRYICDGNYDIWTRVWRFARLFWVMLVVMFTLWLQIYITVQTKTLVTPSEVETIRDAYSEFEVHMYQNHTTKTSGNHHRGIIGFFNASRFPSLAKGLQADVCSISLTQPLFVTVIILLWTITCVKYMRQNVGLSYRLLIMLPTISSMKSALFKKDTDAEKRLLLVGAKKKVIGLTLWVKAFLLFCVQTPHFLMVSFLLWLGSRWLIATIGFGDLVLNAIALEFVLVLHELVYWAVVPHSMKQELLATMIPHRPSFKFNTCQIIDVEKEQMTYQNTRSRPVTLGCWNMLGTFMILLLCMLWSILYVIVLQQVLPDYRWDVSDVCDKYRPKGFMLLFV